jgi:hypothetical protein
VGLNLTNFVMVMVTAVQVKSPDYHHGLGRPVGGAEAVVSTGGGSLRMSQARQGTRSSSQRHVP